MSFIDNNFQNKIKNLPADLQKAIEETDVYSKMIDIRDKYKLLISEGGDLYEEIKKVLAEEVLAEDFPKNLQKKLEDVDHDTLDKIIEEVDTQIFRHIRTILIDIQKRKNDQSQTSAETEENHNDLKKEDVLRDIEEPTPTLSKRVVYETEPIVKEVQAKPAPISPPVNLPTGEVNLPLTSSVPPQPNKPFSLPKISEDKLTEMVTSPKKEIDITPPNVSENALPEKKYAVDPYREPAN